MISTLFFEKHVAWAICNAKMMDAISFFITNVELKQLGLVTLFMTFKEVILLPVHHFVKFVIVPPYMLICVQLVCIVSCTSKRI
jgi:hypothetical protein